MKGIVMKKFYILFIGNLNQARTNAVLSITNKYNGIQGFGCIKHEDPSKLEQILTDELNRLYDQGIEPIIMKGSGIHTEDYIRPIIRYYKTKHPNEKFFLSHCACFDDYILTDGALLTKYTQENIESIIKNVLDLRNKLDYPYTNNYIAMLNAGGDTNPNTAPESWLDIYNNLKDKYDLEMTQFDVATNESIRREKLNNVSSLPNIIIPSSINEANSIWKVLTTVGKQSLAGIVVGIPMYIGLTSRTDTEESITKTLDYLLRLYAKEQ